MDIELIFGVSALVVNLIGYVPYFRGIFRGEVKPQRITWGIWTILTSIAFVNQVANGGGWSSLFFGSTTLLVVLVFLSSFKYGVGGKSKLDIGVLIAATVLLVAWIITKNTTTSTYIAIAIDAIGALPTIIKAYKQPETEAYLQWFMAALAGMFSFLAVGGSGFVLYAYPLYVIIFNALIVASKKAGHMRAAKNTVI
jgi:hypothetical protein